MAEGGPPSGSAASLQEELHELANLLSAIALSAGFALKGAAAGRVSEEDLRTIVDAAERGAELVERLQARGNGAG